MLIALEITRAVRRVCSLDVINLITSYPDARFFFSSLKD